MSPTRILVSSLFVFACASCAPQKPERYDNNLAASGAADYDQAGAGEANPVYDTPAAYEETGAATAAVSPYTPPDVANPPVSAPSAPSNGAAIIHTVVAGDTLSGISRKYKVPSATIKQANHMTNDIVVLGRKMVIPPTN